MNEIILLVVGVVVGMMNSIAGGGMLIGYPVMLAVGISPLVANATSYVAVIPGQLTTIYGYRKYLVNTHKIYIVLLIPIVVGASIGTTLLLNISPEKFEKSIPTLLSFALLLFTLQPFLHFHFHKHLKSRSKRILPIILMSFVIFPIAIYGGFFGVGVGFVFMTLLGFAKIRDVHKINALKNVATLAITLTASTILLTHSDLVNWRYGLAMGVGCALGGFLGAKLAMRFSSHIIRFVVIAIGLISILILYFQNR